MGGEFSILDNYPEMLVELARNRNHVRLVTNGFWSKTEKGITKFLNAREHILRVCGRVDIILSTDKWHESSSYRDAAKILATFESVLDFNSFNKAPTTDHLAPVGRAWDNNVTTCNNIHCSCEQMSNMIIIENGAVGRCPFGYFPWQHFSETTWYDAQEYVWGWRSEKLAEGMNCHACMECVKAAHCWVVK